MPYIRCSPSGANSQEVSAHCSTRCSSQEKLKYGHPESSAHWQRRVGWAWRLRVGKSTKCVYVCQSLNSHYFHIIGDGHQPNSRGLYTHCKDSYQRWDDHPQYSDIWPWHMCVFQHIHPRICIMCLPFADRMSLQDLACRLKERGQHLVSCLVGWKQVGKRDPLMMEIYGAHHVPHLFPGQGGIGGVTRARMNENDWGGVFALISLMIVMFLLWKWTQGLPCPKELHFVGPLFATSNVQKGTNVLRTPPRSFKGHPVKMSWILFNKNTALETKLYRSGKENIRWKKFRRKTLKIVFSKNCIINTGPKQKNHKQFVPILKRGVMKENTSDMNHEILVG